VAEAPYTFHTEDDNVMMLSTFRMKYEEGIGTNAKYTKKQIDDASWLEVTVGAWEMQLPQEREAEEYPVTLWYRSTFEVDQIPDRTRLLIDGFAGREYDLYINGQHQKKRGVRSALDAEMREVDIQSFLQKGENVITVRLVVETRTNGLLDPLKILGDFGLQKVDEEYVVGRQTGQIKIGSWTNQGYPFYSGTGIYETEIEIPPEYFDGRLALEIDCGEDVLEVSINGGEGHILPWHPYRIDLTDEFKSGKNQLSLRVTNTLINMLEGVQKASGLLQPPRIVHAHRYELPVR
jgi:hypothetical protein